MENKKTSKGNILIVDDTLKNLRLLDTLLTNAGYLVRPASDARMGFSTAQKKLPDLILLDVRMPGMDGYEVCEALKADERTRDIPVIFISALNETVDKLKGFAVGGVDYITKPFQEQEVLARVKAHVTIRRQQQQLYALNASKDTFFSIIAHDLKNPFSGFLSFVDLMEHSVATWDKDQIIELTDLLRTSANHLSALLDNLLTWSRIQRGMIDYRPGLCDLHVAAARNIILFTPNAEHKQIVLSNSIPEQMIVSADVAMLDTVMRNLLSNALKFTPAGGTVDVAARRDQQSIEVSVSDTGVGIAEEHWPKLFRIDVRYKRLGTAREKGTGLGLSLCKEFVEQHGGSLWVESREGAGSVFYFTLPMIEVRQQPPGEST